MNIRKVKLFLTLPRGIIGEEEVELHSFLNPEVGGSEWLTLSAGLFISGKGPRLCGPHCRSGRFEEEKNSSTYRDFLFCLCTLFILLCPDCPSFAFCPYCKTHSTQTSMLPAGFDPATPANDRKQVVA